VWKVWKRICEKNPHSKVASLLRQETYGNKILLRPVRPDWANFCPMGDCLLWEVNWKSQKWPTFLCYTFPKYRLCIYFDKKCAGPTILGAFFTNESGRPGCDLSTLKKRQPMWPAPNRLSFFIHPSFVLCSKVLCEINGQGSCLIIFIQCRQRVSRNATDLTTQYVLPVFFSCIKSYHTISWRDSISRHTAPISSVARREQKKLQVALLVVPSLTDGREIESC
jgi:hypothetical protein